MFRRRAARLLAGAAGAASAAGACAAGGVLVASSETRLEPSAEPEPDTRPIEILVHNISHSDMLVMLGEDGDENGRTFLARPVFNKFQPVTEAILQQIAALKVRPTRGTERSGPRLTQHRAMPHRAAAHHATPRMAPSPSPSPLAEHGAAAGGRRRAEQVPGARSAQTLTPTRTCTHTRTHTRTSSPSPNRHL